MRKGIRASVQDFRKIKHQKKTTFVLIASDFMPNTIVSYKNIKDKALRLIRMAKLCVWVGVFCCLFYIYNTLYMLRSKSFKEILFHFGARQVNI